MEAGSQKAENAVDNLFIEILSNDLEKLDYFQAKIDFVAEKVEKFPKLLGYKIYKLHIAQAYLLYLQDMLQQAYEHLETADNILAGREMQTTYSRAQEKILSHIREHVEKQSRKDHVSAIRKSATGSLIAGISSLALGGVASGISYSLAKPGSTYLVTSGLFLVGTISLVRAIYYYMKWAAVKSTNKIRS